MEFMNWLWQKRIWKLDFFWIWFWTKPLLKIGMVNKAFLFWYCLFRKKPFFLFKTESWNFRKSVCKRILWNLTKFQLNQTTHRKNENNNCLNKLNELKFCEVWQNSISNRCLNFQLSILKDKFYFLKNKFKLYCQDRSKRWRLLS